jgi:hypothetical protein
LQDAAFDGEERVGVGYIDTREDVVEWPEMVYWFAAVCHNDEGSLTTNIVDEKLKKGIDRKCLQQ